jgi:transcriptional regulator with XRE-family HTH domain
MGYVDKLQKLCILRGLDQITLAQRVGISKSSMSRILNGTQEPKLLLAYKLASELGVTLDSLLDDSKQIDSESRLVTLTKAQTTILDLVERMGYDTALNRLIAVNGNLGTGDQKPLENEPAEATETPSRMANGPQPLSARRSR